MITTIIVGVVCLVAGFGVGRIKNAAKLAKIEEALGGVERYASSETRALYAAIKSHL